VSAADTAAVAVAGGGARAGVATGVVNAEASSAADICKTIDAHAFNKCALQQRKTAKEFTRRLQKTTEKNNSSQHDPRIKIQKINERKRSSRDDYKRELKRTTASEIKIQKINKRKPALISASLQKFTVISMDVA
jgi:hypothetical protein